MPQSWNKSNARVSAAKLELVCHFLACLRRNDLVLETVKGPDRHMTASLAWYSRASSHRDYGRDFIGHHLGKPPSREGAHAEADYIHSLACLKTVDRRLKELPEPFG